MYVCVCVCMCVCPLSELNLKKKTTKKPILDNFDPNSIHFDFIKANNLQGS